MKMLFAALALLAMPAWAEDGIEILRTRPIHSPTEDRFMLIGQIPTEPIDHGAVSGPRDVTGLISGRWQGGPLKEQPLPCDTWVTRQHAISQHGKIDYRYSGSHRACGWDEIRQQGDAFARGVRATLGDPGRH